MATINTDTGRIKLIRNCSCGGKPIFSFHTEVDGKSDVTIECKKCCSMVFTVFEDLEQINIMIDRVIDTWNSRNSKLVLSSLYGEMKNKEECGCPVCKHLVSCEPNPFGICEQFEKNNN